EPGRAALRGRPGDGGAVTASLPRRDAHPARHGARRHRAGAVQSDVSTVVRREARGAGCGVRGATSRCPITSYSALDDDRAFMIAYYVTTPDNSLNELRVRSFDKS